MKMIKGLILEEWALISSSNNYKKLEKKITSKIIVPTLKALKLKGNSYNGFLYVGLMIKNGEPYLIEYNIRMGDPECQAILPRLKSDIVKILNTQL